MISLDYNKKRSKNEKKSNVFFFMIREVWKNGGKKNFRQK